MEEKTYYTTSTRNYNGWIELFGAINIQAIKDLAKYRKALEKEQKKVNAKEVKIKHLEDKIEKVDIYFESNFYQEWASVEKEDLYRVVEAIMSGKKISTEKG